MEQNVKIIIEYDGTAYHGFQIQPEHNTIQGEIEKSLLKIFKEPVKIYGAGRTDAGVHARGQVANFKHSKSIKPEEIQRALNSLLPDDIVIKRAETVSPDFHARFSAKSRIYQYKILNRSYSDAFMRNFVYFYKYPLDIEYMKEACKIFLGTKDFTSFRASSDEERSNVRTVFCFDCFKKEDLIIAEIEADGFLHNMVRIVMGTILQAGRRKKSIKDLEAIMEAKNRERAGPTLPPGGLTLMEVKY